MIEAEKKPVSPITDAAGRSAARIAVAGCGYWGKNLVRVFHEAGALEAVCEVTEAGVRTAHEMAPGVSVVPDFRLLVEDSAIDAIVVATAVEASGAVILTGDPNDLGALASRHRKVVVQAL